MLSETIELPGEHDIIIGNQYKELRLILKCAATRIVINTVAIEDMEAYWWRLRPRSDCHACQAMANKIVTTTTTVFWIMLSYSFMFTAAYRNKMMTSARFATPMDRSSLFILKQHVEPRVVVAGATGYIGRHVVQELVSRRIPGTVPPPTCLPYPPNLFVCIPFFYSGSIGTIDTIY